MLTVYNIVAIAIMLRSHAAKLMAQDKLIFFKLMQFGSIFVPFKFTDIPEHGRKLGT
jgi:hypothetical protein